jgi:NAD(P)-dependent dehydrogenase (short-subunit alcohol dehydrogenase family)
VSGATVSGELPAWWRGVDAGHRLAGKRTFVTGAGTTPGSDLPGIGEAIAVLFAAQGAKVAIADISAARAEATLRLVGDVAGGGSSRSETSPSLTTTPAASRKQRKPSEGSTPS